jgi:glycosyltransferase involved in cell wall biosynthesis
VTSVLHVISGLATGGAETTLANVACALLDRGLAQHVVTLGGEGSHREELKRAGVAVSALNLTSAYQAPRGILTLSQLIRSLRPEVVQGWMYHGNLMAALAHRLAPGRSRRRLLWNLRASNMDASRYASVVRWGRALSGWPDVVIANSEAGASFHASQGYRSRQTKVIANGIDAEKYKPDGVARSALRLELRIPDDAVVVMHVARVDAMKDHPTYLAAMKTVPDVIGIMVGARTDELQAPSNVRGLGLRRDVERLYAMADVVISSSAFGEGFSNSIAEGMSAGLVPISTDVGDARLIVGNTGRVVAPRDPQALAAAVSAEAAAPTSDRTARGLAARARIIEHFSLVQAVDTYERLYRSLTAQ